MKKFSYWNIWFYIIAPFFIILTSFSYSQVNTNPDPINFASLYNKTDTLKTKLTQNPNLIVESSYSEKPNYKIDYHPDSLYGIQLRNATSLFSINSSIIYWIGGNPHTQPYIYGNGVTGLLYNNGVETFIQGDSTRWSCDFPAGVFSDTKFFQEKKFFIMNIQYNPNNLEATAMPIRQLAMDHGDPYISRVMFTRPNSTEMPTKFMFVTERYLTQDGQDATSSPGSYIDVLCFLDSYIFPLDTTKLSVMRLSTWGITRVWDLIDSNNYKAKYEGVEIGSNDAQGNALQPGILVQSIVFTSIQSLPKFLKSILSHKTTQTHLTIPRRLNLKFQSKVL